MKDHSKLGDFGEKYILSYSIHNKVIINKLASGKKYVIPYTPKNEKKVIDIMENQARTAEKEKSPLLFKLGALLNTAALPFIAYSFFTDGGILRGLLFWLVFGLSTVLSTSVISTFIKNRDVDKLNYFLKNRKEINEETYKTENMKLGVSKKASKQIDIQARKKKAPINLCNIDYFSLKDLKTIKENIDRYHTFGFEEIPICDEIPSEDGPKLTREYK